MTFSKIVILVSHIPILAATATVVLLYTRLSKPLKAFSWFIILSGIIQFLSLALWFGQKNNLPLLHVYVPAGFVCLAWFYKTVLGNFINTRILQVATAAFVLFTLGNTLFVQHIFTFNSNALVAECTCVIMLALFTFLFFLNRTVKEAGIQDIKSLTWINSGLFVYYLSSVLIYYLGDAIIDYLSLTMYMHTWTLHAFFSMVMYTCFLIGLWKREKKPY